MNLCLCVALAFRITAGEIHDLRLDLGPAGTVDLSVHYSEMTEELLDDLASKVHTHGNPCYCILFTNGQTAMWDWHDDLLSKRAPRPAGLVIPPSLDKSCQWHAGGQPDDHGRLVRRGR